MWLKIFRSETETNKIKDYHFGENISFLACLNLKYLWKMRYIKVTLNKYSNFFSFFLRLVFFPFLRFFWLISFHFLFFICQILRLLFKFVPPRCRRETLRLVCKRWNQICDDCIFTKEDQLVFDPPYDFQSVVPLLVRSPRKLLNLCLIRQQICWTTIEIGFWKSRGHRVESICLIDSLLNLIDLKKILAYCPNLKKLSIRYNGTKYLKKFLEKFEEYDSANFNASSVTIFQFSLEDHCMNLLTNYSLFKILSTFPSIANLEIGLPFSCVNSEEISVNSAKYISVPGVINAIHLMRRNLKQLYLRLNYTCSCHMSKFVDLSQMLPQLEKYVLAKLFQSALAKSWNFGYLGRKKAGFHRENAK